MGRSTFLPIINHFLAHENVAVKNELIVKIETLAFTKTSNQITVHLDHLRLFLIFEYRKVVLYLFGSNCYIIYDFLKNLFLVLFKKLKYLTS